MDATCKAGRNSYLRIHLCILLNVQTPQMSGSHSMVQHTRTTVVHVALEDIGEGDDAGLTSLLVANRLILLKVGLE